MKHSLKRVLACLIAVLMITSIVPFSSLAANVDNASTALANASENFGDAGLTVITDEESNLAPGITMNEVAVYDKNGNRVEMFIATADTTVDTVKIQANYKDNDNSVYGMQRTTEQVAAAEANHEEPYNVVAAINASYYNTSTGKPTGAFVMEGKDVTNEAEGNNYAFFAVLKDGTHMIGAKGEYSSYKGQIEEAIGGYIHIVKDGAVVSGLNKNDKYPRQTLGIREDGKVIIMTADGNQAPKSDGLTIQEQAEVMLAMGCVEAIHLDGGGSATFCAKREGTDEFKVLNSPSNGSERAVSNTLMFVSTAVADGTFDHANLTADNTLVTPNSTVNISAIGVDAAGGVAEIPENIVWQLEDASFGTVENGVFTSTGKTGDAIVQLVYEGNVVGEVAVTVAHPQSISFGKDQLVVPFGETVKLKFAATVGVANVVFNDSDFTATLSDAKAGVIDGLSLTAPDASSGITNTTLTLKYNADESIFTTINVVYGKGSEVIFDFEDGTPSADTNNWVLRTHESKPDWNEQGDISIVNSETGRVRSGEQALAFHTDFSQTTCSGDNTTGYHALSIGWNGEAIPVKGAQSIGFWLYIPEDAMSTEITLNAFYTDANGVIQRRTKDAFDDNGELIYTPYWSTKMEGSGWHYVKADFSKFTDDLFIHDEPGYTGGAYKRNFFIKLYAVTGPDTLNFSGHHGDFTYYIDDVTVDYSDAVEDRELPVFSNPTVSGGTVSRNLEYGNVAEFVEDNAIFNATVADNTSNDNYTGIDASTAKVYVDGVDVGAKYSNGMISSENVELANGFHKVRFEIADNNGNVGYINREFNVTHVTDIKTVELVPHDATLDRLLAGSVYWVDLTSDDIDTLNKVETTLNLNSVNAFELENMDVNAGFDVTYTSTAAQDVEDIVELTFTRNGEDLDKDSNVIASIPVRVWEPLLHTYSGHTAKTPQYMWTKGYIQFKQVNLTVDKGIATFTDDKTTFSGDINVDHEGYTHHYNIDQEYWEAKGTYHVHTAEAIADKAATCTEPGYTGRTFCEVCNSVVEWGETSKATGHTFAIGTDGILDCDGCGKKYTGEFEGKDYVDGVVSNGWKGESYYVDGAKLTGVNKVMAPDNSGEYYYDFGENGICKNQTKYTGLFKDEEAGVNRYAQLGELSASWKMVGDNWYYFNHSTYAAVTGEYNYYGIIYNFDEEGRLISGTWVTDDNGTRYYRYKNTYYYFTFAEIDGKTYYFDKNGYMVTGYANVLNSPIGGTFKWHLFAEDGELIQVCDGIMDVNGTYKYFEEGFLKAKGLIEWNGDVYYTRTDGYVATGKYYVGKWSTDELAAQYPAGYYYFDETGKMINRGIVDLGTANYYIENNVPTAAGLVEVDGEYYFARTTGVLAQGKYYVTKYSDEALKELFPANNHYYFDETGKMIRNAVYTLDDGSMIYLGANGQPTAAGLIEVDGKIYYARTEGYIVTGDYNVGKWSTVELEAQFPANKYMFRADGTMIYNCVYNIDGTDYYVNPQGQIVSAGLVEIDGEYYYARTNGVIAKDRYYVGKWSNDELKSRFAAKFYYFDETGKMIRNNFIIDDDGAKRYVDFNGGIYGAGLVEVDGEYYYARTNGYVATGKYYVGKWSNDELKAKFYPQYYEFDETGKMIRNAFITDSNGDKRFINNVGAITGMGLVEVDGNVYYIRTNGYVATGSYYVGKWSNADLEAQYPAGKYNFDADGKMIIG
ncbi:MAG: phosphodiester glycosidase family protein [Ruminococcus sp.]|nr:phosphodiester glycosidase family protein [Ruminococcus sp.]